MPRVAKNASHQQRAPGGMFTSNPRSIDPSSTESDGSDGEIDDNLWETDEESLEDKDYYEAWERLPVPRTFEERVQRNAEKRERAAARRKKAEMRGAERREAGDKDNQQGKRRGPYGVGGLSRRSIQEKKKKLRDQFQNGELDISTEELNRQLASIDTLGTASSGSKQMTITSMFSKPLANKRPRALSAADSVQPSSGSSKRSRTDADMVVNSTSEIVGEEEEEEGDGEEEPEKVDESELEEEEELSTEQLEEQARREDGDNAVDSIVIANDIADWVETVLDDAAPKEPAELQALAVDSLKGARKQKDYRSEILFAALADFYRWMPRMGTRRCKKPWPGRSIPASSVHAGSIF
ncbi:hypothetical protein R3P38DRAFT_3211809 [Favolaschia claudopus]|uniref:Uncharacterized protein n=1 Tax=Favolaschia claudopus TaxID=2862362 RepID=A0AAW0AH17_9AGAR